MIEFVSPLERWPGRIWTEDYMLWSELVEWEAALDGAKTLDKDSGIVAFYAKMLPISTRLIRKWEIKGLEENVTVDNFPASPDLVAFVIDSITSLYKKTNEVDPK